MSRDGLETPRAEVPPRPVTHVSTLPHGRVRASIELRRAGVKGVVMMVCYCCNRDVAIVHRVSLRGDPTVMPPEGFASPDSPAYQTYVKESTYRPAFICPACYHALDNELGIAGINGRVFNLAGRSRGAKAPVYDQSKYDEYERRESV